VATSVRKIKNIPDHFYAEFSKFKKAKIPYILAFYTLLKRRVRNIPISKKLYFTISIMAVLVTVEICTLWVAVNTLSAVRSFVAGEGLWSKAEKDAVLRLHIYGNSHDKKDYNTFKRLLQVPAGDKKARLELLKKNPDLAIARQGFYAGRNNSADIDGMIALVLRFQQTYYLNKAFTLWAKAEPVIDRLAAIGERLHDEISVGVPQNQVNATLAEAEQLNQQLTQMEDGFSNTLGEGASWLESLVLSVLIALSLTIGSTSILITVSVNKGIAKGLKAILDGADLISRGVLNNRVSVFSEDEIGLLALSFNSMTDRLEQNQFEIKSNAIKLKKERDKAEASEKVKQLFLTNMSHELRTPMNAILGFAHLLEDKIENDEDGEHLKLLIKAGDDLLVLLNDILDFSKIESGRIVLESMPFKISEMVHDLAVEVKDKAAEKSTIVEVYVDEAIPDVVLGDAKRLNQVLFNLLSNAVKFTDRGEIYITIYLLRNLPHYVELEFSIKDTGIGIAEEHIEKIFERFEQADGSTERKFGGAGIGLSIVKQLVELQGGKIAVNSTPGRGSEFHFRLSFLKVKASANQPVPATGEIIHPLAMFSRESGPTILVVDDNSMNRLLVVKLLQKYQYKTDVAENGVIALSKHKLNSYDLILMDLQMPEMDGYETTRQIRTLNDNAKNVPIIAMTAHAMDGEMERCMALGMDGFVPKPFAVKDLYDKIEELLEKQKN
jgi:signal transduction histidine kinase/ActR/RegA family two-component response regulator